MSAQQPPIGRTVLCLPLSKFSYATVTPDMPNVPWVHKSGHDFFVLVERITCATDPNLQLRVVENSNTLVRRLQQTVAYQHQCLCYKIDSTIGRYSSIPLDRQRTEDQRSPRVDIRSFQED